MCGSIKMLLMEYIKEILKIYWPQILAILIFIASFILQCLKKKPVQIVPNIQELIYKTVPDLISKFEKFYGPGNGDQKKHAVIDSMMTEIERSYALNDNQRSLYKYYISSFIEVVLSTPQKK